MSRKVNIQDYKYRFFELLFDMPHRDYEEAMQTIPKLLQINPKTWKNWIYLKKDSFTDIPANALIKLSFFFDTDPIKLLNTEIQNKFYGKDQEIYSR